MCCSNDTEMAPSDDLAAGYWGSYSCDVPTWTFEDMLNHIKEQHLDVSFSAKLFLDVCYKPMVLVGD